MSQFRQGFKNRVLALMVRYRQFQDQSFRDGAQGQGCEPKKFYQWQCCPKHRELLAAHQQLNRHGREIEDVLIRRGLLRRQRTWVLWKFYERLLPPSGGRREAYDRFSPTWFRTVAEVVGIECPF